MLSLARTSSKGTAYSASQVALFLTSPTAQIDHRFQRLDASGRQLDDFSTSVLRKPVPTISHDTAAAIHRTLNFSLSGDYQGITHVPFNPLRDLIEPFFRLATPDGGWVEWSLGVFTLAVPARTVRTRFTRHAVTGADLSQLLVDAAFQTSFGIAKGTSYVSGLQQLVNQYLALGGATPISIDIADPGATLPTAFSWQPGTSILTAVNDLLNAISYIPAWFDRFTLRSTPIPDWSKFQPSFTFDTTAGASVVSFELGLEGDLSNAFNIIIVIVENPQGTPIYTVYTNNSPTSKVSVGNFRPKPRVIQDANIANAAAAAIRARSEARKSAWIYTLSTLNTLPWPLSQNLDVYKLVYSTPDEGTIAGTFLEVAWQHALSPAQATSHKLTQIVPGV